MFVTILWSTNNTGLFWLILFLGCMQVPIKNILAVNFSWSNTWLLCALLILNIQHVTGLILSLDMKCILPSCKMTFHNRSAVWTFFLEYIHNCIGSFVYPILLLGISFYIPSDVFLKCLNWMFVLGFRSFCSFISKIPESLISFFSWIWPRQLKIESFHQLHEIFHGVSWPLPTINMLYNY